LRDWALGPRALCSLVSYIDPANAPSAAVAQRLGGRVDPQAATPGDTPTHVYRYVLGAA
ncbi:MAG: N-acetyltransferase, partial [Rhodobacteraceae bacterium]|nr:N-acetyltransferase [Paracoccaceae bacterium]